MEKRYLTREEAAEYLRCSLSLFQRKVQPHLPACRINTKIIFDKQDIDKWLARQKAGGSVATAPATTSASPGKVSVPSSPRAKQILQEQRLKRRGSMPGSSAASSR